MFIVNIIWYFALWYYCFGQLQQYLVLSIWTIVIAILIDRYRHYLLLIGIGRLWFFGRVNRDTHKTMFYYMATWRIWHTKTYSLERAREMWQIWLPEIAEKQNHFSVFLIPFSYKHRKMVSLLRHINTPTTWYTLRNAHL